MRFRTAALVSVVTVLFAATLAHADAFQADPVHSSVVFKIMHMNTTPFWGRFNKISGSVNWDATDASKSTFEFTVPVDSIDTNNAKRDSDVKGADLFNVKQFPTMTFKSTAVKTSGDKIEITGDLTLHGQTKSINVTFDKFGPNDTRMGKKLGLSTSFTIKRSDYGMNGMQGGLGDEVEIHVSIEAGSH